MRAACAPKYLSMPTAEQPQTAEDQLMQAPCGFVPGNVWQSTAILNERRRFSMSVSLHRHGQPMGTRLSSSTQRGWCIGAEATDLRAAHAGSMF
eukprot:1109046-Amphidinium_carterae.1